ncbi:GFA family protein [uncultured Paraglaciecola sp.]|uniref:GFA family protein n=1 Tax=uncultured Paraglaciecola sp. TaxID=1765024 RepID=UPI002609689D|nr:GFA family protein [uncultured Paraglaciecola sp.]
MENKLEGGCFFRSVEYVVEDNFSKLIVCHCTQCQQITGSSQASNLLTDLDNIIWLRGKEKLIRYDDPERDFTKVFCSQCGSGLPFVNKSNTHLIVPAGSLRQSPSFKTRVNLFPSEQPSWHRNSDY